MQHISVICSQRMSTLSLRAFPQPISSSWGGAHGLGSGLPSSGTVPAACCLLVSWGQNVSHVPQWAAWSWKYALCGLNTDIFWIIHALRFIACLNLEEIYWMNIYLFSLIFLHSLSRLLYSLAFNARFLRHLWFLISSMTTRMITGYVSRGLTNWAYVHGKWQPKWKYSKMVF